MNESLTSELERYKERVKTLENESKNSASDRETFLDLQLQDKTLAINELQHQLAQVHGKSPVTQCESPNFDSRIQKIEDENVFLAFLVSSLVKEQEHIKLEYKKLYDSIKQTREKIKLQTDSLQQKLNDLISKNHKLRAYKLYSVTLLPKSKIIPKVVEKIDLSKLVTSHLTTKRKIEKCTKVLSLGLLKIKSEPINAYFKNNRVVHHDYLKVTKEHVATLKGLLVEAKALKPLDEHIGHASKFAERIQELLVYVSASCPFTQSGNENWAPTTSHKKNNKPYVDASRTKQTTETITQKHAVKQNTRKTDNTMLPSTRRVSSTNASGSKPRINTKNDRIQQTSNCDANVKNVALSKNSANVCLSCNECLFSANHNACVAKYQKDVQKHRQTKSVKQEENFEWKPTRRIFKTVGLKWIPTGRKVNLVRIECSSSSNSTLVIPPRQILTTIVILVVEPCPKLSLRYANARESLSKSHLKSEIHPFNLHDYGIKRILSNDELPPWKFNYLGVT
ncbi:hypothetical protein Tco_1032723 [Tanacetum coccineum]|uniref:Integrase, catalytic region, zinc finger, CCHC-type, peptidase aspartic, catalytic n=1 Tax=Tanacetum coccineum TaxID=301880 RepID=A0ABQ5GEQ2_9ASTR